MPWQSYGRNERTYSCILDLFLDYNIVLFYQVYTEHNNFALLGTSI